MSRVSSAKSSVSQSFVKSDEKSPTISVLSKTSNGTKKSSEQLNIAVLPSRMRPRSAKSDLDAVYNPKEGVELKVDDFTTPGRVKIESAKDEQSEKRHKMKLPAFGISEDSTSKKATPGLSFNIFLP